MFLICRSSCYQLHHQFLKLSLPPGLYTSYCWKPGPNKEQVILTNHPINTEFKYWLHHTTPLVAFLMIYMREVHRGFPLKSIMKLWSYQCSLLTNSVLMPSQWVAGMWPGSHDLQGCRITGQLGSVLRTPEEIQHPGKRIQKLVDKFGGRGLSEDNHL